MHDVVFKLALAVVLSSAIFFLLAVTFSEVGESANETASSIEEARRTGLERSASHLQR